MVRKFGAKVLLSSHMRKKILHFAISILQNTTKNDLFGRFLHNLLKTVIFLQTFDIFICLDSGFGAGTCSYYRLTIMRISAVTGGKNTGEDW